MSSCVRLRVFCALVTTTVLALEAPQASAAATAHASWHQYPLSNGHGVAVFDATERKLNLLLEHPYAHRDADSPSADVLWDAYFGVADPAAGHGEWLNERALDDVGYEPGRGVLTVRQSYGGLELRTRYFAPVGIERPAFAMVLEVTNPGPAAAALRTFALVNLHLGTGAPEATSDGEVVTWDAAAGRFRESGTRSGRMALYQPLPVPTRHAASPANPWPMVRDDGVLTDSDGGVPGDDQVGGYQWDLQIPPGASRSVGVLVVYGDGGDSVLAALEADVAAASPDGDAQGLVSRERAAWDAWSASVRVPSTPGALAAPGAEALYRQSLVMLRMGQVREPNTPDGRPFGQLLASLPPGMWNIAWPRDASYAIRALSLAGRQAEARDALGFFLTSTGQSFTDEAEGPYRVSVCRYFGDGSEESDWNDHGPNIEFDGFGLVLWAIGTYLDAFADDDVLTLHWPVIRDEVADALVRLVDPETGLIRADSSIWEVHWDGEQKRYAYTSIVATRGLCEAARMADRVGDGESALRYRSTARDLARAIRHHLLTDAGVVASSLEEKARGWGYTDAAVVEAINAGLLRTDEPAAAATLDHLLANLRVASGHGYYRNDDGGEYDRREWVFIDLRLAVALRALGRTAEADALERWVVDQSLANGGLVAELYDETTADYAGAVPMMGFGAGAFVLAAWERAAPEPLDETCFPADPSSEPSPEQAPERAPEPVVEASAPASDAGATPELVGAELSSDIPAGEDAAPLPDLVSARDAVADDVPTGRYRKTGSCASAAPGGDGCPAAGLLLALAAVAAHLLRGRTKIARPRI